MWWTEFRVMIGKSDINILYWLINACVLHSDLNLIFRITCMIFSTGVSVFGFWSGFHHRLCFHSSWVIRSIKESIFTWCNSKHIPRPIPQFTIDGSRKLVRVDWSQLSSCHEIERSLVFIASCNHRNKVSD